MALAGFMREFLYRAEWPLADFKRAELGLRAFKRL